MIAHCSPAQRTRRTNAFAAENVDTTAMRPFAILLWTIVIINIFHSGKFVEKNEHGDILKSAIFIFYQKRDLTCVRQMASVCAKQI